MSDYTVYKAKAFSEEHDAIIELAHDIILDYMSQGYSLTLRGLYYQFIRRDYFPNNERSYKRLGNILNDARLAGRISFSHIEDRSRNIVQNNRWLSPAEILQDAISWYHIDMWQNQNYMPEVWVEKDALVSVVAAACEPLDVTYFACRGYVSQSEEWASAMRLRAARERGQTPVILYLGDHDPSGIDMTRDHRDRLAMFMGQPVEVVRLALNWEQVQKYNPPPNPAKLTDSRSTEYIARYGNSSWELDALEPAMLVEIIKQPIISLRDEGLYQQMVKKRELERNRLRASIELADEYLGPNGGEISLDDVDGMPNPEDE